MQPRTTISTVLLGGAAALAGPGAAVHAHVIKQYHNANDYWFTTTHLPDLDQIRTDLPNDGRVFCVPTSGINWLGYLTNHGWPALATGPDDWALQDNYALATFLIASMGSPTYMNTDAFGDGTTVSNSVYGLQTWLGDGWVVSSWIRDQTWSPDYEFLAARGLAGAHLLPGVGWYEPATDPCPNRHGGHAFAVEGMAFNGLGYMDIRDPATDEGEAPATAVLQSPFTSERYLCLPELRNPKCGVPGWQSRLMWRLNGLTRTIDGETAVAYLDYVRSIFPQLVITAVGSNQITYHALEVDGGLQPIRSYSSVGGQPIVDVAMSADVGFALVVSGSPGATELWKHTTGFDRWEMVDLGGAVPTDAVTGRHRDGYALADDGARLIVFDVDTLQYVDEVTLPGQCQALVYDDAADEVVLLSMPEHAIIRYPQGLAGGATLSFPGDLPFADDASLGWDPTDGTLWCIAEGDPTIYHVNGTVEMVDLPGLVAPVAIDVSDTGRLFVSDQGLIMEFVEVGPGVFDYPPDRVLPGRVVGPLLSVARSRSNFEPELVDGSWYDELPTTFAASLPECIADVNGDLAVDVADLVAVIVAWNTADPFADVNSDGTVDVSDLVEVILAWGDCPAITP